MNIDKDLLLAWGGKIKKYPKDDCIFMEGDYARFYYQIIEGSVKSFNINDNAGKEFTQGLFSVGNSFGEAPLLIDENYPAAAVSTSDTAIIILSKERFINVLNEYPDIHLKFTLKLAQSLHDKAVTFKEVMSNSPQTRLIGFLNSYKKRIKADKTRIQIPYTRQEIANFTGLRVETVIRTLQRMCIDNLVEIHARKLFY
jgi:CRP/FNR family transcriptional regulator